jgi:hypothetical protein
LNVQPRDKRAPGNFRIQGEGDYISGRRYQKDVEEFAKSHDTEKLARKAAPRSRAEKRAMAEAERKGKARAKGRKVKKRRSKKR